MGLPWKLWTVSRSQAKVYGRTDVRTYGRTDGRTYGRTDRWTDRRTDGRKNGRMEGRMDGCSKPSKKAHKLQIGRKKEKSLFKGSGPSFEKYFEKIWNFAHGLVILSLDRMQKRKNWRSSGAEKWFYPRARPGRDPATLWTAGARTNHYTTGTTSI